MAYALRRLMRIPTVLLATFVLAFALAWAAPRTESMEGPEAAEACDRDAPFVPMLARALFRWAQLDVDPCTGRAHDGAPVLRHVARALPPTLTLAGGALAFAIVVAVLGGTALARGSARFRKTVSFVLAVIEAIPGFIVAPALLWMFGLTLRIAPAAHPSGGDLALPVVAVGVAFAAAQARAVRETLLGSSAIALRLALLARGHSSTRARASTVRLAALPVLGALGATTSALFMSAIAVEIVFSIPGLGLLVVNAAGSSDFNLLFGAAIAYAVVLLAASAFFDVAYAVLDPRVRGAR